MARRRTFGSDVATEYLQFAAEFRATAEDCASTGRWRVAGLNAIHAAIAASDAVCASWLGEISSAESHGEAAELLAKSGAPEAGAKAVQFGAVIDKKSLFAYEARPPSRADAAVLLQRATRLVNWAHQVVKQRRAEH